MRSDRIPLSTLKEWHAWPSTTYACHIYYSKTQQVIPQSNQRVSLYRSLCECCVSAEVKLQTVYYPHGIVYCVYVPAMTASPNGTISYCWHTTTHWLAKKGPTSAGRTDAKQRSVMWTLRNNQCKLTGQLALARLICSVDGLRRDILTRSSRRNRDTHSLPM